MKKPVSYRYCPEYNDRIAWTTSDKNKQNSDDLFQGMDQKRYLKEREKQKGDVKYNSKEWVQEKQDDKKEDDLAQQIKELQNELKKFDYNNMGVYDQLLQNDNPPLAQEKTTVPPPQQQKPEQSEVNHDAYNVYGYDQDYGNAYQYG